ncbi:MAG: hypothetical protein CM15mP109_03100 [Candidatus Dadabacteria bacterium]|nr:MAG: hypothetical protein CM15mP109_03100 [Candidatus Dadabacteria bacterium]
MIQADGGTRTASISGAWVALRQSINNLLSSRDLLTDPIIGCIGAVSCGIYENVSILDLDYDEDSKAEADANFCFNDYGGSSRFRQLLKLFLSLKRSTLSFITLLKREL